MTTTTYYVTLDYRWKVTNQAGEQVYGPVLTDHLTYVAPTLKDAVSQFIAERKDDEKMARDFGIDLQLDYTEVHDFEAVMV